MEPVQKRFTISAAGSTCSRGTGGPRGFTRSRSRRATGPREVTCSTKRRYSSQLSLSTALCSARTMKGLKAWGSPALRKR